MKHLHWDHSPYWSRLEAEPFSFHGVLSETEGAKRVGGSETRLSESKAEIFWSFHYDHFLNAPKCRFCTVKVRKQKAECCSFPHVSGGLELNVHWFDHRDNGSGVFLVARFV